MIRKFVFEFNHDETNDRRTTSTYFFDIMFPTEEEYCVRCEWRDDDYVDGEPSALLAFTMEMESYGVHDCVFSPDTEFFGFSSGEIEPGNWPLVMEKWRDFFVAQGFNCGPVEEATA